MSTRNVVMNIGNDIVGVRDVVANVRDRCICIDRKLSLETNDQQWPCKSDRTHAKDMKDPIEVLSPGRNRVFVAFCVEKARNCVAFVLLDDLPLNLRHGSVMNCVSRQTSQSWFNPHRQLGYRLTHRLAEVVQSLPVRSSIKGPTYIGAVEPELNKILFINHTLLVECQTEARRSRRKRTLIIVSRTLTEPKTALAGVMLDISFARFKVSIVTFSVERAPFRPFGRWEFAAIVEDRGSRGEAV
jgi:hypothetical protein